MPNDQDSFPGEICNSSYFNYRLMTKSEIFIPLNIFLCIILIISVVPLSFSVLTKEAKNSPIEKELHFWY